ncbi:MAG: succinate dehydrogenase cytochrome b subunit [Acidimicrobiia bacterium]
MTMTVSTENEQPGADDADRLAKDYGAPIPVKRSGPWPLRFWRSAVGKKWVMAVTGLMLLGFVFGHMLGNLKIFLGEQTLNHYAEWLRSIGEPVFPRTVLLWIIRFALIGAFAGHIISAYQLTRMNHRARPVKYQSPREYIAANYASRTMRWTGIIVGLFLLWHLADLTWGLKWVNGEWVRGEAYQNVVWSLDRWPVAMIYIVANIALAMHISHGAWSMFQSLGWNNPRWNPARRWFAYGFAAVILVGNLSIPIAILSGAVKA